MWNILSLKIIILRSCAGPFKFKTVAKTSRSLKQETCTVNTVSASNSLT